MKIRSFRKSDLDSILKFKKASARVNFPRKKVNITNFRKKLLHYSSKDRKIVKVIEEKGRIVGYIWFCIEKGNLGRYGIVHHIFIDNKFRGHGLAKRLMKIAEGYFKSKGIKRIKLTVTVTNIPSIKMCNRLGYKRTRIIMEKRL